MLLRARACRSGAVRLRRDRASGASRPSALRCAGRVYAGALARASAVLAYSEHEAESLGLWLRDRGRTCPSHSSRSASTSMRSARTTRHPTSTSSRSGPTRTGTSTSCSRSPARCRTRASSSSRAPSAPARSRGPPNVPSRPIWRSRTCATGSSGRGSSHYRFATTATRARRRSLLQAMALGKPVAVTRTAAIAAGYGLVDGENVRFAVPGDTASFGRALGDLLRDDAAARIMAQRARETVKAGLDWERYVERLAGWSCGRGRRCGTLACRAPRPGPLAFGRASEGHRARRAAHGTRHRPACPHRGRTRAHSRQPRRPRALPRVRAVARRGRAPVPPRAVARAREPGSRGRARTASPAETPAVPLQLVQLRLPAPAALRAPRRADGAPGRRADRRVPGVRRRDRRADRRGQRRARVRDDLPVGVLAREASRARLRAARAGRHPERGRPGDLPSAGEPRAARGQAGEADREQLVGQPPQGRGDARLARRATSTPTASSSPSPGARRARSSASASSGRSTRARSPSCSGRRTSTSRRAATTPARMHCSRRSRAACRRCTARAAGIPSSSARAGSRFGRTRSSAACSIASSSSSTSVERRSRPRRSRRSRTATSRCSACARPPRLPRRWRTTCDGASGARASVSTSGSTGPRSRARTTSSTCRTRGPRRRGSARRRSRTRSTSGSTRRSWSRRGPSSIVETGHVPRRERLVPRLDLRPARRGRGDLDRHRAGARRLPGAIRGSPISAAAPRPTPTSSPRSAPAPRGSGRS